VGSNPSIRTIFSGQRPENEVKSQNAKPKITIQKFEPDANHCFISICP
jgi:hypothetical protein